MLSSKNCWKGRKTTAFLLLLVLARTLLTFEQRLDIQIYNTFGLYIKLNDIVNILISICFFAASVRSMRLLYTQHPIGRKFSLKFLFLMIAILANDTWLIIFIYSTWISSYAIVLQLLQTIPALVLLLHSTCQAYFIASEYNENTPNLQVHSINRTIDLNTVMIVHLLCTLYTSTVFKPPRFMYNGFFLLAFLVELLHRLHAIEQLTKLRSMVVTWLKTKNVVEVVAKKCISFDGVVTTEYDWNEYGFIMKGVKVKAKFNVKMVRIKKPVLPDNFKFLSPVYSVTHSEDNSPLVTIMLQHCGTIIDSNNLTFMICKTRYPPYKFEKCMGGVFHSCFSSLTLNTDKRINIAVCGRNISQRHLVRTYYKHNYLEQSSLVHYVFVQNTTAERKQLREIYSKWKRGKDDIVEFLEDEDITIKMPTTYPIEGRTTNEWYPIEDRTINEWKLQINKPLKAKKSELHSANHPKYCELKITWQGIWWQWYVINRLRLVTMITGTRHPCQLILGKYQQGRIKCFMMGVIFGVVLLAFFTLSISLVTNPMLIKSLPGMNPPKSPFIQRPEDLTSVFPGNIGDAFQICFCLGIPRVHCQQISREHKNIQHQIIEIAHLWYRRHTSIPKWEYIVDALMCSSYCLEACELAKEKDVDINRLLYKYTEKNICVEK